MNHFVPGNRLKLQETNGERLWFLPAECEVIESITGLRGRLVRARLSAPIPLRNSTIAEIILVIDECGACEIYMGFTPALIIDPILKLGRARVA